MVTIVFADVVGFTTLSERRDPEQLKRLIDGCMARLVGDVTDYGGTVDKILGDGLLVLYGAPVAHEDDAERAVRSAMKMLASVEEYGASHGVPLQLRVGVNTGEVLVGALRAGGDYTAMGDVVNTASRLQMQAPIGRVLVGETTRNLAQPAILFEPFGEVSLRGREQSVEGWLAVEAVTPPGTRHRREDAAFVGRDAELTLLSSGLQYAMTRGRALLVAIDGEGGVGKSRLVDELLATLPPPPNTFVFEGQCVPYGESNIWWPIAGAVMRNLGVDMSMPPDELRAKAVRRVAKVLGFGEESHEIDRVAEAFAHLLGLPSALDTLEPASARAELGRAVVRVMRASIRGAPIVAAITDLHWADPVVLDLFEQILVNLAELPFVLVTTARAEAEAAWPPTGGAYGVLRLRLEPLDAAAAGQLAAQILGEAGTPETLDRLFEQSGGNPLFLEELAALAAERGSTAGLPDSLRGLVAARLDLLAPEQRAMLDNAAVLGTSGIWPHLKRFAQETGQVASESTLTSLVEAGLLAIDGQRWWFRSESVRDVAYQTLTKSSRALRHAGVAMAMAEYTKRPEDAAHHWATAAELAKEMGRIPGVPADVTERAIRWLSEAASHANEQMYARSCIRLTTRGLELLSGDDHPEAAPQRRWLRVLRAAAYIDRREIDKARSDLDAVIVSATADGDTSHIAHAQRELGELKRLNGDVGGARDAFDQSIAIWRAMADDRELARALRGRGFLEVYGGLSTEAGPFFDEADILFTKLGDKGGRAWLQQHRAWAAFTEGDLAVADDLLHKAARTMDELGDRAGLGWVFGLLAYVRFNQGDRAAAESIASQVIAEAEVRGDDWAPTMMHVLRANLALWEGQTDQAIQIAERARQRMHKLGDVYGEVVAYAPLARAYAAAGQPANAQRTIEEMAAIAGTGAQQGFPLVLDAEVAVHLGEPKRALHASNHGSEFAVRNGLGLYEVHVVRALALLQLGRLDDALIDMERAESMAPGLPFSRSVAAIAAALDALPASAIEHADAVDAARPATYLDRIYAGFGRAGALRSMNDDDGARRALAEVSALALTTGDVVAQQTVAVTQAAFGFAFEPEVTVSPMPGWRSLAAQLATVTARVPAP